MTTSLADDSIKSMADHSTTPVAQLSTISLAKLRATDAAELSLLDQAASNTGFFYLDLRGDVEGNRVLAHLPDIYAVVAKYFGQSENDKEKDIRRDIKESQDLGWKRGPGGESFEISRDEVAVLSSPASISHRPIPEISLVFANEWKKIIEFSAGCDDACLTLLNNLSLDRAVHNHRADQPSDTGLKFVVLHPSLANKLSDDVHHTDSGTLTLLFYEDWGLQAFLPDANIWAFIVPREGCALINVADSLQRLSGGKFHSPTHGVTQPFDEGAKNQYYLSYFLRPETALVEKWDAAK